MDMRELARIAEALGARVGTRTRSRERSKEKHRRDLLVEWRERRKTERATAAKRRPPFRVGVPPREIVPVFPPKITKKRKKKTVPRANKNETAPISPFVTIGRGSSRNSSIGAGFRASPVRSTRYFRLQLNNETSRLQALCNQWRQYKTCETLEDEYQATIDATIGQTQLLINKKFQQFEGLINKCENLNASKGEGNVNIDDLQGFWDMMYMQVENVDIRFDKLETLKTNDWIDDSFKVKKNKIKRSIKKKKVFEDTKSSSKLKAAILAAKQRLKEQQQEINDDLIFRKSLRNRSNTNAPSDKTPVKTEQGFLNMAVDLHKTPSKSILKTPVNRTSVERISTARKNKMKVLFSPNLNLSDASVSDKSICSPKEKLNPKLSSKKNISSKKKTRRTRKTNVINDENISPCDKKSPENIPLRRSRRLSEKSPLFQIS